jgi:hypothetical protein
MNNKQLLDEVEQNFVICQLRAISYLPMPSAAEGLVSACMGLVSALHVICFLSMRSSLLLNPHGLLQGPMISNMVFR